VDTAKGFDPSKIALLKQTYAKGATDTELQLFLTVAAHRGLDPFSGQIVFVKRNQKVDGEWKSVGTFQVTIDGFRSVADRTGAYMPSDNLPTFAYAPNGALESATVEVLKWHEKSQQWMRIKAIARYDEFAQVTQDGKPMHMWAKMPHNQLAKCAEALAFRKAFPQQVEGLDVEGVEALPAAVEGQYTQIPETAGGQAGEGIPAETDAPKATRSVPTFATKGDQLTWIEAQRKALQWPPEKLLGYVKANWMRTTVSAMPQNELDELCGRLIAEAQPDGAGK
jgi:phage recombination protein Bet